MTSTRILVVGAGAVGGFLGARLVEAGRDVTFLVRPGRAAVLAEHGLTVRAPTREVTLQPTTVLAGEVSAPYDLVLVSVKGFALAGAIHDLRGAVGPNTLLLPVLNGMQHLAALADAFGAERLLGGACVVATQVESDGSIRQLADGASLTYGELDGSITDRVEAVDRVLQGAGFTTRLSGTIRLDMWEKWVFLAAAGALTCLLRGSAGEIEAVAGGADVARAIIDECAGIATAAGFPPRPDFLDRVVSTLTTAGSSFTSSMYRDLVAGHPVEVDQILGDLLTYAVAPTPLVRLADIGLRVYQQRIDSVRR